VKLAADGSLQLQATAPSMGDIARYILNMYTATHLFASVAISTTPSPGNGGGSTMGGNVPSMAPAGIPAMAPQTQATAGLNAISSSQQRLASVKKPKLNFGMNCSLTEDWKKKITPPAVPGGAAGGPAMPGH
jgi:hypothetical protein